MKKVHFHERVRILQQDATFSMVFFPSPKQNCQTTLTTQSNKTTSKREHPQAYLLGTKFQEECVIYGIRFRANKLNRAYTTSDKVRRFFSRLKIKKNQENDLSGRQ